MYLKSLQISNFRKFGTENNVIEFVDAENYEKFRESDSFDIAKTTTLIVGKNNVGKTTIVEVLEKLIKKDKTFCATDFNFLYLKELLDSYSSTPEDKRELPYMEFIVGIGMDKGTNDLLTNLIPFMSVKDVGIKRVTIKIRYEVEETEELREKISELLNKYSKSLLFNKYLELLDKTAYKVNYYSKEGKIIPYNLRDLMDIKPIKANIVEGERGLSKAFNRIVKYRYNASLEKKQDPFEKGIINMNRKFSIDINNAHTKDINSTLDKLVSSDKMKVLLSADLSFQKLIDNLVKYEYVERDINIPENQFGLGYTNLMMIIANLLEYMEKYPEEEENSKINLISIEEPETFMHPQMQELFIKNINEAIRELLKHNNKKVNSQL